jgi:hypothetical protein
MIQIQTWTQMQQFRVKLKLSCITYLIMIKRLGFDKACQVMVLIDMQRSSEP